MLIDPLSTTNRKHNDNQLLVSNITRTENNTRKNSIKEVSVGKPQIDRSPRAAEVKKNSSGKLKKILKSQDVDETGKSTEKPKVQKSLDKFSSKKDNDSKEKTFFHHKYKYNGNISKIVPYNQETTKIEDNKKKSKRDMKRDITGLN